MLNLSDGQPIVVAPAGGQRILLKVKSITSIGNGEREIVLDEGYDCDEIHFETVTQNGDDFMAETGGRLIRVIVEPADSASGAPKHERDVWKDSS